MRRKKVVYQCPVKIVANTLYKTRSGRKVRVYATDGYAGTINDYYSNPIHGAILEIHPVDKSLVGWTLWHWHADGRCHGANEYFPDLEHPMDIVEEWKEPNGGN